MGEEVAREWLRERHFEFIDSWGLQWLTGSNDFFERHPEAGEQFASFFAGEDCDKIRALMAQFNSERIRYKDSGVSGGESDLIAKMPRLTFIEVKTNGADVSPRQRAFLKLAKNSILLNRSWWFLWSLRSNE
jgi:hypothetical protein